MWRGRLRRRRGLPALGGGTASASASAGSAARAAANGGGCAGFQGVVAGDGVREDGPFGNDGASAVLSDFSGRGGESRDGLAFEVDFAALVDDRENKFDARNGHGGGEIEFGKRGVGVGGIDEAGVQHAGKADIVGVEGFAGGFVRGVDALHLGVDQPVLVFGAPLVVAVVHDFDFFDVGGRFAVDKLGGFDGSFGRHG